MNSTQIIGAILIAGGTLGLAWGGFSYRWWVGGAAEPGAVGIDSTV